MTLPISRPQQDLLDAWRAFAEKQGRTPSVRELCRALGRAPSTIHQMLRALEKKNLMQSDGTAHGWRACAVDESDSLEKVTRAKRVVIRGTIAAGSPIEALDLSTAPDGDQDSVMLPAESVDSDTFALRVRGDSMIDDHILDGDVIVVRRQSHVDDGEIAVALLDDGTATLKRVYREVGKKRIRLQPANSRLGPLYVSKVDIQGRVVGVVRMFRRA